MNDYISVDVNGRIIGTSHKCSGVGITSTRIGDLNVSGALPLNRIDMFGGSIIDGAYTAPAMTQAEAIAHGKAKQDAWNSAMEARIENGAFVEDVKWKSCVNLNAKDRMDDACWSAIIMEYPL